MKKITEKKPHAIKPSTNDLAKAIDTASNKKLSAAELFPQALASHQKGNLAQAQILYETILREEPRHFDALLLLGVMSMQKGDNQKADDYILQALSVNPNNAFALSHRSNVLARLRRYQDAFDSACMALKLMPDFDDALINCGVALENLRRYPEALLCYQRLLYLKPNSINALFNLGNTFNELGRIEESIACFDQVIQLHPNDVDALFNRANGLRDLKRFDDALAAYDHVLRIEPLYLRAINNRANLLRDRNRHAEALAGYDHALKLQADYPDALNNKGNALRDLHRHPEAMLCYERALQLDPLHADAHWNAALCLLMNGDFARGWEQYEWRWKLPLLRHVQSRFMQPSWLGQAPLQGKTILLYAEQGLGDTIQFSRYAKLVAAQGAIVLLEVQPSLKSVLAGLEGVSQIFARGQALPSFDWQCPLLSLPLAFKTDLSNMPQHESYLQANPTLVARWKNSLADTKRPLIGIVWSGSAGHVNDVNRSIPLADLVVLFGVEVAFVSLQKEMRAADRTSLEQHPDVIDAGDKLDDFSDTAALIARCDLVLSVDTSVAHLAGAMGKPVWILLPYSSDWRWLLTRKDSPWYPTARLFRQHAIGDWHGAIEEVACALREWCKK